MDPSLLQGTLLPKEPPKLVRGLDQGPPLPSTNFPPFAPSKKVLKIGEKEITFLINPLALEGELPQPTQGVSVAARPRLGIGRGAGFVGKPELPFSRLERMQNSSHSILTQEAIETSDWLRETGGGVKPTNNRNENDWSNEKEGMNDSESAPAFHCEDVVDKDTVETMNESNPVLYLLRGCPGSGKSTLATELKGKNGRIFSTDDFFVQADGEYVFDPKKVAGHHKRNQERAREAISQGVTPVVIDNTNTTFWEMRPYVETGLRHGYRVEFVEPTTPWRYDVTELSRRNTHGVPEEVIKKMLKRFQKNPTVSKVLGKRAKRRMNESQTDEMKWAPECSDMPTKLNAGDYVAKVEEFNGIQSVPNPYCNNFATNQFSPFGVNNFGIHGTSNPYGATFGTGMVPIPPQGPGNIFTIPFVDLLSLINNSFQSTK